MKTEIYPDMFVPERAILQRVFAISPNRKRYCTCFAYPIDGFFHFITAAHELKDLQHGVQNFIYILRDNVWDRIETITYFVSGRSYVEGDIDVAIIKTSIPVSRDEPSISLGCNNMIMGQDAYFLGYPYIGKINYPGEAINFGFPIPFIKRSTLSKISYPQVYFDGHNNPGFSGGPVILWDYTEKKQCIVGIISSYITQQGEIKNIENEKIKQFYDENSGIFVSYSVNCLKEFIPSLA